MFERVESIYRNYQYHEMVDALILDGALHEFQNGEKLQGMFWAGGYSCNPDGITIRTRQILAQGYCMSNQQIKTLEMIPLGIEMEQIRAYLEQEGEWVNYENWTQISDVFSIAFAQAVAQRGGDVYLAVDGASPNSTFRRLELPILLRSGIQHVVNITQDPAANEITVCRLATDEWYYKQRMQWMTHWLSAIQDNPKDKSPLINSVFEVHHAYRQIKRNTYCFPQWSSIAERELFEYGMTQLRANKSALFETYHRSYIPSGFG